MKDFDQETSELIRNCLEKANVCEELQNLLLNSKCNFSSNHVGDDKIEELYKRFYQSRKKLQLQINDNNKYELYKTCVIFEIIEDQCNDMNNNETYQCSSLKEQQLIKSAYDYIKLFNALLKFEKTRTNGVGDDVEAGSMVDKCTICETEISPHEKKCSSCDEPVANMLKVVTKSNPSECIRKPDCLNENTVDMKTNEETEETNENVVVNNSKSYNSMFSKSKTDQTVKPCHGGESSLDHVNNKNDVNSMNDNLKTFLSLQNNCDKWNCGACSCTNSFNSVNCVVCYSERDKFGTWLCEQCTLINKFCDYKCKTCEFENKLISNSTKNSNKGGKEKQTPKCSDGKQNKSDKNDSKTNKKAKKSNVPKDQLDNKDKQWISSGAHFNKKNNSSLKPNLDKNVPALDKNCDKETGKKIQKDKNDHSKTPVSNCDGKVDKKTKTDTNKKPTKSIDKNQKENDEPDSRNDSTKSSDNSKITASEENPDIWTCWNKNCKQQNVFSSEFCEFCNLSRHGSYDGTQYMSKKVIKDIWVCKRCTKYINVEMKTCPRCHSCTN